MLQSAEHRFAWTLWLPELSRMACMRLMAEWRENDDFVSRGIGDCSPEYSSTCQTRGPIIQ